MSCNPDLDVKKLMAFVSRSFELVNTVLIAVQAENKELMEDVTTAVNDYKLAQDQKLRIVPIAPWSVHSGTSFYYVTPALNGLLLATVEHPNVQYITYMSIEIKLEKDVYDQALEQLDDDTLVVGVALVGHEYNKTTKTNATGTTTPWNTCATWDRKKLSYTGFLPISDGIIPGVEGMIEEVPAITLLQRIYGIDKMRAKLLFFPGLERFWMVNFEDNPKRLAMHEKKMETKKIRAAGQLNALGFKPGTIEHYKMDLKKK